MAFIHEAGVGLTGSTGFAVVTPHGAAPTFVYRWVTSDACIDHLAASASGSAYPAVNSSVLASWRVPLPPDGGEEYGAFARPTEARRHALAAENDTLTAVRDALLPKLISGQIRVPDTADPAELIQLAAETLAAAS
jgi:type I restriction enzyme S subunit